jgi:predicted Zn finger-like uncharacterized protein
MTLATRCTACGTVFRVVQDQLRVSDGWVRCGRCTEVFNAVENLVDPPLTAAPLPAAPPAAAMARMGGAAPNAEASTGLGPASGSATGTGRQGPDSSIDLLLDDEADALPEWARSDLAPTTQPAPGARVSEDFDDALQTSADAGFDAGAASASVQPGHSSDGRDELDASDVSDDASTGQSPSGTGTSALAAGTREIAQPAAAAAAVAATSAGQPLPSFVRRADSAARWQRPRVRTALAAVCLLGLLTLLAQAAHSYRDLVAARWPAMQPLLAQACGALGCSVQAPRLIDALVVDSSGLLRVELSSVYELSVTLRNREGLAVAVPALDLSLTDTQGRLVARRVLLAEELGSPQTSLAAGAELVLQATLLTSQAAAGQAVAGYTIDLFYP